MTGTHWGPPPASQRGNRGPWGRQKLARLRLTPPGRRTLADRVADILRRRILFGDVSPGERLASHRALRDELGVGLSTVREAVAQLKSEGLVEVRHGTGMYVARRPRSARVVRATQRRATRHELEDLRQAVEPMLARRAAKHATRRALVEIHHALGERTRAAGFGDTEAFVDADTALHLWIHRAARNALAASGTAMAMRLLRPALVARAHRLAGDHRLTELHRVLVEAIGNGRALRAERAARAIAAIETSDLAEAIGAHPP